MGKTFVVSVATAAVTLGARRSLDPACMSSAVMPPILGPARRVLFVVALATCLGACGGGGDSASPAAAAAVPPPAAPTSAATVPAISPVWSVFEAASIHGALTTAAFNFVVDDQGRVGPWWCAASSLDGTVPAAGTPLPAGTHTYAVAFSACTVDGLVGIVLTGSASATYTLSGDWHSWGDPPGGLDLTAQVSAQSLRGSNLAFRSGLFDVTGDGSGTWAVATTASETTRSYTPATGSTLRNNASGNVATFGGGTHTSMWSPSGSRERFDGIVVTIGGTSYVLDGTIEHTNGSPTGQGTEVGEVRITAGSTLVARVFGQNGSLLVEELAPIATF